MTGRPRDDVFDKPLAYEDDDGRVVYRASSLGACDGALVRARLGVTASPPPDDMQLRFDEGHQYEAEVIARGLGVDFIQTTDPDHLALHGKVVESEAGPQVETEIAWGNKVVRCHPDAIATQGSTLQKYVVEAKFFGADLFYEVVRGVGERGMLGLGRTRAWQASVEMLSTGLPLLYVVGMKDIIEVDGERVVRGVGEVWTAEFTEPCYGLMDVKARVLQIEGFVARGEMPSCPVPFDYPCGYWAEHEKVEREVCTDEVLTSWVDVWRRAVTELDKAQAAVDFARGAIAEQMIELKLDSTVCDGVEITHVRGQDRGNVSWAKWAAAVKKAHPEVKDVSEDEYRGEPRGGYVRISEAKDE